MTDKYRLISRGLVGHEVCSSFQCGRPSLHPLLNKSLRLIEHHADLRAERLPRR